jgi:hypothetical protein
MKRKQTYDLAAFKAAFDDVDKLNITGTATRTDRWCTGIRTGRYRGYDSNDASLALLQIDDLIRGPSELARCVLRAVGGGYAVRQIHGRRVTAFRLLSFKEKDNG